MEHHYINTSTTDVIGFSIGEVLRSGKCKHIAFTFKRYAYFVVLSNFSNDEVKWLSFFFIFLRNGMFNA